MGTVGAARFSMVGEAGPAIAMGMVAARKAAAKTASMFGCYDGGSRGYGARKVTRRCRDIPFFWDWDGRASR
jgi:hypothetical protein